MASNHSLLKNCEVNVFSDNSYSNTGTYTVTLKVDDTDGPPYYDDIEKQDTLTVYVFKVEIKASDGVSDPPTFICKDYTKTYKAVPTPALSGTYLWEENSPKIEFVGATNQQTVEVKGVEVSGSLNDASFKVTFTPTGSTNSDEDTHDVTVHGGPIYANPLQGTQSGEWLYLKCPVGNSPTKDLWVEEQPSGTTYLWEIIQGGDKAHIVGSNTNRVVTLRADAASTARLDVHLRVTCTLGGHSCQSTCGLTVHTPNQANSSRVIGGFEHHEGPPLWWMLRVVTYTIRNQFNIPIWNAWWDESFSQEQGDRCYLIGQGDGPSDQNGVVPDVLYWEQYEPWDGWSLICRRFQTIKVDGCPLEGSFWSNWHEYTEQPMITVTPQ